MSRMTSGGGATQGAPETPENEVRRRQSGPNGHLILAPPLERKLISLCQKEGLIDLSEGLWRREGRAFEKERISTAARSHLLASVFLHPRIKLKPGYEADLPLKTDLIALSRDDGAAFEARCEDFNLLLAYCRAADRSLNAGRISDLTGAWVSAHDKVIEAWGVIPNADGNGEPVLMGDFFGSILSKRPMPSYSETRLSAYREYCAARAAASVIERCVADLNSIWSRRLDQDAIAIHPGLQRGYTKVLDVEDFENGLTETDVFFLSVRALRTLPVGRTLTETLELSARPEGVALRQRVAELHGELLAGQGATIAKVLQRIERDADDYRALTARLVSPNVLSEATDLALGGAGLIPVVGTIAGGISLLKSGIATFSSLDARRKLKKMLWATYQGRSQ